MVDGVVASVGRALAEPYGGAIRTWLSDAEIPVDPFHVVALAGAAGDEFQMQE